jgi:FkbM family methyltransferase
LAHAHLSPEHEKRLVREFFGGAKGFFVDVGANDPREGSQSWHLEEAGWNGILVEPQPQLAAKLREMRRAPVFAVACSSPENSGRSLPFHVAGPMSSLDRTKMAPGAAPEAVIQVPVKTLDELLVEAKAPAPVDLLSVDVEGHEIEVLSGFDFARWRPRLIILEDHVGNLDKHRFLQAAGYRVVRYLGFNGWYVPTDTKVDFGWRDRWEVLRKYYLALPFRVFRNVSRRIRQPFKDARAARDRSRGAR